MSESRDARLRIYMLGCFEMYYNDELVRLKKKQSAKPVLLLQMLLNERETGVSRGALVEALYGAETRVDTANNLNTTVSQLRRLLRDSGLPDGNYIRSEIDRYFFDCPFHVWVDVEEVERLRLTAQSTPGRDSLSSLYQLCDLFQGRFLPDLDGDSWVEIARAYYQRVYRESLEQICRSLMERRAYAEVLRLTQRGAKLFPFDEWQAWQLDALLALGRVQEAQELYRQVERLYLDELDAPPPDRMRLRLQKSAPAPTRTVQNLQAVRDWLTAESVDGPYALSLPNFLSAYSLVSRMSGAARQPVCLMLCTLRGLEARRDHEQLKEDMERLENALAAALAAAAEAAAKDANRTAGEAQSEQEALLAQQAEVETAAQNAIAEAEAVVEKYEKTLSDLTAAQETAANAVNEAEADYQKAYAALSGLLGKEQVDMVVGKDGKVTVPEGADGAVKEAAEALNAAIDAKTAAAATADQLSAEKDTMQTAYATAKKNLDDLQAMSEADLAAYVTETLKTDSETKKANADAAQTTATGAQTEATQKKDSLTGDAVDATLKDDEDPYVYDDSGNKIAVMVPAYNEDGTPQVDENGKPVMKEAKDADGNIIYLTKSEADVKAEAAQAEVDALYNKGEDGGFIYYEVDAAGNPVIVKNGSGEYVPVVAESGGQKMMPSVLNAAIEKAKADDALAAAKTALKETTQTVGDEATVEQVVAAADAAVTAAQEQRNAANKALVDALIDAKLLENGTTSISEAALAQLVTATTNNATATDNTLNDKLAALTSAGITIKDGEGNAIAAKDITLDNLANAKTTASNDLTNKLNQLETTLAGGTLAEQAEDAAAKKNTADGTLSTAVGSYNALLGEGEAAADTESTDFTELASSTLDSAKTALTEASIAYGENATAKALLTAAQAAEDEAKSAAEQAISNAKDVLGKDAEYDGNGKVTNTGALDAALNTAKGAAYATDKGGNLIQKTDENGVPVVDANGNAVYVTKAEAAQEAADTALTELIEKNAVDRDGNVIDVENHTLDEVATAAALAEQKAKALAEASKYLNDDGTPVFGRLDYAKKREYLNAMVPYLEAKAGCVIDGAIVEVTTESDKNEDGVWKWTYATVTYPNGDTVTYYYNTSLSTGNGNILLGSKDGDHVVTSTVRETVKTTGSSYDAKTLAQFSAATTAAETAVTKAAEAETAAGEQEGLDQAVTAAQNNVDAAATINRGVDGDPAVIAAGAAVAAAAKAVAADDASVAKTNAVNAAEVKALADKALAAYEAYIAKDEADKAAGKLDALTTATGKRNAAEAGIVAAENAASTASSLASAASTAQSAAASAQATAARAQQTASELALLAENAKGTAEEIAALRKTAAEAQAKADALQKIAVRKQAEANYATKLYLAKEAYDQFKLAETAAANAASAADKAESVSVGVKTAYDKVIEAIQDLSAKLLSAQTSKEAAEAAYTALEDAIDATKKALDEATGDVSGLKESLSDLQAAVENLDIENLQFYYTEAAVDLTDLMDVLDATIEDEDVPLAGIVSVKELVGFLYEREGYTLAEAPEDSTDMYDYSEALAWAVSNKIVDEDYDPDELVTVGMAEKVLTRYASFKGSSLVFDLDGADDDIVEDIQAVLEQFLAELNG